MGPKKRINRGFTRERRHPSFTFTVGHELEYRVARLFISLGYFVRRGRELYTVASLAKATDLDVMATKYEPPFRRHIQIVECKEAKNAGPLDRIFWLSGVRHFVKAGSATLVRSGTSWNVKDFAKEAGVEILDIPRLAELEASVGIDPSFWPSISDREYFTTINRTINEELSRNTSLCELAITLAGEVRFHQPLAAVNYLLFHLRRLTELHSSQPESPLVRVLITDCVSHLLLFMLRIAETTYDLSPDDRSGFISKGLSYGSLDPVFVDRTLRNAAKITEQILLSHGIALSDEHRQVFSIPSSEYVNAVTDILGRVLAKPQVTINTAALFDLLAWQGFCKRNQPILWSTLSFTRSSLRATLKEMQAILGVLEHIQCVPPSLQSSLSPLIPGESKPIEGSGLATLDSHTETSNNERAQRSNVSLFDHTSNNS